MSQWKTDMPFAPVPMWVIELPISDRAFRLYSLLAGLRDYDSGQLVRGRQFLADKLGCSVDTIDRAKAELIEHEAISVEPGEPTAAGGIPANVYTVHRIPAAIRNATAIAASVRSANSRNGAAPTTSEPVTTQKTSSSRRKGLAPATLDGRKVSKEEEAFGVEVLGVFNAVASEASDRTFRFASKEAVGKIILRHREHPELDAAAHRSLIEAQFAAPWWRGDPTPSVIYGNGEVFDRALNGVRGAGPGRKGKAGDVFDEYLN